MATHFSEEEVEGLDPTLVSMLDWTRESLGLPIVITCGRRSPEENEAVGGVADSAHLKGLAVDLRCPDSHYRFLLTKALLTAGFTRIEQGTEHIHVDLMVDDRHPKEVMWLGISH